MKIGIDTTALPNQPAGAGIYIIHLTRALAAIDHPHEMVVFAQQHALPLLNIKESERLHLEVLPNRNRAERLLWEQMALPRLARQHQLDLLHSPHYTMPLTLPCASVVTFHDMIFFVRPEVHTLSKRYFFRWAIQLSSRRAQALIANSESTRRDTIRFVNAKPEKIFTVHLGVTSEFRPINDDKSLQQIRKKYTLPDQFILYVGVVEPRKNLSLLLQAFEKFSQNDTPYHLVIAGQLGWMYAGVLRKVEESGLKDRIHFLGFVPHEDLPEIFNLASVFVYPSLYEGFGIPVLEAIACGTPMITTNISSIPEVAGDCALLVPPDNLDALIDALENILNDAELRERLAKCGPERAKNFTWDHSAQKTLAVYNHVLSGQT